MLTVEMLRKIEALLPGPGQRCVHLRRLVRTLANWGGSMTWLELCSVLGAGTPLLAEGATWDGIRQSRRGDDAVLRLAPWVRRALGMELEASELLEDTADHPIPEGIRLPDTLDDLRSWLARARNIASIDEALDHAGQVRFFALPVVSTGKTSLVGKTRLDP